MQESVKQPGRSYSPLQIAAIVIVVLVVAFLIIGTINQSSAPEPTFGGLQAQPFTLLAVLAFVAGILSFVSPCTLPILPAYFAFAFQSGRKQIALNTVSFMLGLAALFSVIGAGASFLGRILRQNQTLILLLGGSLVLFFGVMSILGKGFTGMQRQDDSPEERRRGVGGSFIFGMTFAVGWTSCIGPILGTVTTMAGTTGSVLRGMMLLFIYALGLGLPLIIVSTFFGRASRKSFLWRILRGKGWLVNVPVYLIGLIWALAIWRILVAIAEYVFINFSAFAGQELTTLHEYGLLPLALVGVALWIFTSSDRKRTVQLQLHTTLLVSGALFILLGILMLNGNLANFNSLVPTDLAIWFADIEEWLISLVS